MADRMLRLSKENTTCRERIDCVIEHQWSCGQSLSCELSQVLTLRGFGAIKARKIRSRAIENRYKV